MFLCHAYMMKPAFHSGQEVEMCAVNKNSLAMQKKFRFKKHLDIDGYHCLTVMFVSESVFAS